MITDPYPMSADPYPLPICAECRIVMRVVKNSVMVNDPAVGPHPATRWMGDKFGCPECGSEFIWNFGHGWTTKEMPREESITFYTSTDNREEAEHDHQRP